MSSNELKEYQSYSCTDCTLVVEIIELDDINNTISFKCPIHGLKTMAIKDYLKNMKKNTFLYNTCSSCKNNQNEANNNEIFYYCTECKIVLCNNCIANHDNQHLTIKNNKNLTNCPFHPKNYNISYCFDCNCHICNECIEHRKHMRHNLRRIEDNQPSNEEVNNLLNIINKYKDQINNSEIENNKKLIDRENKFNKDLEKEKNDYEKAKINLNKELQNALTKNENNYNNQVNEIKKMYEKELNEKKNLFLNNNKLINDKYEKKNNDRKLEYDEICFNLEKEYKNDLKKFEKEFNEEINKLKELLIINSIIYNTYNKNKENYFHNINIINLLINYFEKGNNIVIEMKNNEDFMETINQKYYESSIPKSEEINLNKSFVQENKISNQIKEQIVPEDKYNANTSPRKKSKKKTFITNIDNNKDFQENLYNNYFSKNLDQNFISNNDDNKKIQNNELDINNNNNIYTNNNENQNFYDNIKIQNKETNKNEYIINGINNNFIEHKLNNNLTNPYSKNVILKISPKIINKSKNVDIKENNKDKK